MRKALAGHRDGSLGGPATRPNRFCYSWASVGSLTTGGVIAVGLEKLVDGALVRAYGWSTDNPAQVQRNTCLANQRTLNVVEDAPELIPLPAPTDV